MHHITNETQSHNMSFTNKVYTITGLAGMGLDIAKRLHAQGARLSLADLDQSSLDNAYTALGASPDTVLLTKLDVRSSEQVNNWVKKTVEKFGRLDGAANFAGVIGKYHGTRDLIEREDDEWDLIIGVNLTGTMYCMRAQMRAMLEVQESEKKAGREWEGGSIVNAASIQGVQGFAKFASYSASKHGVIGLSRSVAKEMAERNIRVNCIAP